MGGDADAVADSRAEGVPALTRSWMKTVVAATAVTLAGAAAAAWLLGTGPDAALPIAAASVLLLAAAGAGLVAAGGVVVLLRARAQRDRGEDLFLRLNRSRSEAALAAGRRPPRLAGGLRVGDEVEIRPREEIERTLDAEGRLDGLPFMPEMVRFCGTRARVFRRVDKIYDFGGAKDLRRLRATVSLVGLRCDGSAHAGCEAQCYLLWKTAWLRPATRSGAAPTPPPGPSVAAPEPSAATRYDCQFTSLVAASSRLSPRDPRQDLRPLLAGNVTLRAFLVAVLTRLFNGVQARRGGPGFPGLPPTGARERTPRLDLGLEPGDRVRVRAPGAIAATLDARGRNRGLWFDRDMLKFCGREFRVEKRVGRIIDDATGKMVAMKTPCITLEGVLSTGEYLRFCPQHDPLFWREIWLERADGGDTDEE